MNTSFPNMSTLLGAARDQPRPFAWINELSGFLRRNWRILAVSAGVVVVTALTYVGLSKPRFTASTTLLIDAKLSELLQEHPITVDAQVQNAQIESEVEVLRSAGLARKVLIKLDLVNDPAFSERPSTFSFGDWFPSYPFRSSGGEPISKDVVEDRQVARLLTMVAPHRIGLTYVIDIDATATSPILAAKLANGWADAYIAEQSDVRDTAARQSAGWIQARLLQLQDQAVQADQAAQRFKSNSGIVDTGRGLLNEQQLAELNSQLIVARGKTAEAVARLDRVRRMTRSQGWADMATSDMLQSPVINSLRERYLTDSRHVAQWSVLYGHDHAAVALLRQEMVQIQVSINSEIRRIEATTLNDVDVDRASEAAINAQLDAVVTQSQTMNKARATLRSLQSSADAYRSLYVAFLQRATQATQDEAFPVADARIVTQARPPLKKSKPQGKLILLGATIVGLGIGTVLGLLRDALDRRIRDATDLTGQTGLYCLATLPTIGSPMVRRTWLGRRVKTESRDAIVETSVRHYAVDHPETPFGLGISRLQLRLRQRTAGTGGRLIGLIAATHGTGTTTIASNLVHSMSHFGHDVARLDLSITQGSRERIRERMDQLRHAHDIVVIDFPALSRPCEAHAVFADIDDMALLVNAGRLDGVTLLDRLRDGGLDRRGLCGVVLNNVRDQTMG